MPLIPQKPLDHSEDKLQPCEVLDTHLNRLLPHPTFHCDSNSEHYNLLAYSQMTKLTIRYSSYYFRVKLLFMTIIYKSKQNILTMQPNNKLIKLTFRFLNKKKENYCFSKSF